EMPRMDGFDLAKSIRNDRRTREIPIIIISSRTAEKHRKHAIQCGVDDFLGKPYQESELLRHIETLIARRNQAPSPEAALHRSAPLRGSAALAGEIARPGSVSLARTRGRTRGS